MTVISICIQCIKRNMRLILGIILGILGIVFIMIPFLPFGYAFIFIACFFLAAYIPALKRFLDYLKKKDKKGRLNGIEKKIEELENLIPEEDEQSGTTGSAK